MTNLSRRHIKYVLGIDIPLNEQISISKEQALLIIESQLLYENFLDSIKKFAGDIKSGVVKGFSDFKDFASTLYRVISDGISGQFSDSLLRTFSNSEIKKTIDSILQKIGQPDLLKNLIDKVKKISNPIGKLIASIGFTTVAKFFYDKFKDLDLTKDNIKQQVLQYIKSFLSDAAIEALEGFFTGGFSSLKSWLEKIGIGAATIYNTVKGTIDTYKDAFVKQDAGNKFAVKLVKENIKTKLDLDQIKKGIEVEMEHTNDPKIALKIAMDHIKEDPKYYDKLVKAGLEELNEGEYDDKGEGAGYNLVKQNPFNIKKLVGKGIIFVTKPGDGEGGIAEPNWEGDASIITLYNMSNAEPWMKKAVNSPMSQAIQYIQKDQNKLIYNGKYNQIVWGIEKKGLDPKDFYLNKFNMEELNEGEFCPQCLAQYIKDNINTLNEAEYKGRKVQLGVPMAGDVKKFKVYVKNDKGNVVKVNFGQKGVKIKKNNPARRKSFRARHHCDTNPGPKWKARYWSCRKW